MWWSATSRTDDGERRPFRLSSITASFDPPRRRARRLGAMLRIARRTMTPFGLGFRRSRLRSALRSLLIPFPRRSLPIPPTRERSEWWGGWLRVSASERGVGWGCSQQHAVRIGPPPRPPLRSREEGSDRRRGDELKFRASPSQGDARHRPETLAHPSSSRVRWRVPAAPGLNFRLASK